MQKVSKFFSKQIISPHVHIRAVAKRLLFFKSLQNWCSQKEKLIWNFYNHFSRFRNISGGKFILNGTSINHINYKLTRKI